MNPTHPLRAVLHRIGISPLGSVVLGQIMLATCSVVVPSLAFTAEASAAEAVSDSAESLVLIRKVTGPDAEDIQVSVEAAVGENYSAVSASGEEDEELAKGAETMVSMSAEKKYRAYVAGVVVKGQKGRDLTLTVFSGDTGEAVGEVKLFAINMKKLGEKVDSEAGKELAALLAKTQVASPKEEPSEAVKLEVDLGGDDEEESDDEADDAGERPSALDVNAAAGVVNLDLSYNQPIADSFGYVLQQRPSTPIAYRFGGHLYPAAFFTSDALADIGIAVNYYQSIGGSITVNGTPFDLVFAEINLGLRGRIRLGESELGIYGGVGQTGAVVEGDNEPFTNRPGKDPGLFPDMNYKYLRFGVDGRTPVAGALSLGFGAYFRLPDVRGGVGQLGEPRWFPRASATGFDGQLNLYYELSSGLSLMAGGDARVYSLSMHSSLEDERNSAMAGGAVDRYLGGFVGLDFRL